MNKSIIELAKAFYEEMEALLEEVSRNGNDLLTNSRASLSIILLFIARLKEHLTNYNFPRVEDEIYFFKNLKPKFLSKLIFFKKVFKIQSGLPVGSSEIIKNYYLNELQKINNYYYENNDFLIYYRSNLTHFDTVYFTRKEPDSWLVLNFDDYETDLRFTTIYDHKLSKIIAYGNLSEFIQNCISNLENKKDVIGNIAEGKHDLKWTSSKVSIIELLYALQSIGSFNHGNIDLKTLASYFERLFKVDLGNYYRVFQEIRIRKINRTIFLDQLKERLIQRMDESDENPKSKY